MSAAPMTVAVPFRPAAALELIKPITWFAPMWAFGCGVVSAGPIEGRWALVAGGVLLAGPLVCGTSQAANDWFDRHVDAINEPGRPIPSGRIPGRWGLYLALIWTAVSLVVARALGPIAFWAAVGGLALAWAYSAPPLRLKRDGWWGNAACAVCYEGVPWITATGIIAGHVPLRVAAIAALYSVGAHGIMTLNDFKAVEGDRRMGILSLPVQHGVDIAAGSACVLMAVPQVLVIALLLSWGWAVAAGAVCIVLLAQLALMPRLLRDPRAQAPFYQATGTSLYVLGMLACAIALRP